MILVLESLGNLSERSWRVLEFAGMQRCGCGCDNIPTHTSLVLVICSYSDKTFFL